LKLIPKALAALIPDDFAVALVGEPTGTPHHVMGADAVRTCMLIADELVSKELFEDHRHVPFVPPRGALVIVVEGPRLQLFAPERTGRVVGMVRASGVAEPQERRTGTGVGQSGLRR
jgi:hypothetical protein